MPQPPLRLELPFPAEQSTVNAYLFLAPEPTLIDTGDNSEEGWLALVDGLARFGLTPQELRRVIITHTHIDHFGHAARLAAETDAEVQIIDAGFGWLTDFSANWRARLVYYRTVFLPGSGLPTPLQELVTAYSEHILATYRSVPAVRASAFRAGDTLNLGDADWTVLHTPGHASMQTCFFQPESGALLSSDMLLARMPTPVIEQPLAGGRRPAALPLYLASLARLEAMAVDTVFPGHGTPFADHRQVIGRQRQRVQTRKSECLQHVRAGASTPFALLERMYPHSSAPINMAGLWMLIGYLDLLETDGQVEMHEIDGVWHYRATAPHGAEENGEGLYARG